MSYRRFPVYRDGREIVVLSRTSKKGQEILSRASRHDGYTLTDCYTKPSDIKCAIFRECLEMFTNDVDAHNFHICSHNVNQFSVTWTTASGVVVLLTRDYEYIVTD